jgi:hypothetical protein
VSAAQDQQPDSEKPDAEAGQGGAPRPATARRNSLWLDRDELAELMKDIGSDIVSQINNANFLGVRAWRAVWSGAGPARSLPGRLAGRPREDRHTSYDRVVGSVTCVGRRLPP